MSKTDEFRQLIRQSYCEEEIPEYGKINMLWKTHLVIWIKDGTSWYMFRSGDLFETISESIITQEQVLEFLEECGITRSNINDITDEIFLLFKLRFLL